MNVLLFEIASPTIIILVVAAIFLLFGGSKLPQLARALGQSKKAFKEGIDDAAINISCLRHLDSVHSRGRSHCVLLFVPNTSVAFSVNEKSPLCRSSSMIRSSSFITFFRDAFGTD